MNIYLENNFFKCIYIAIYIFTIFSTLFKNMLKKENMFFFKKKKKKKNAIDMPNIIIFGSQPKPNRVSTFCRLSLFRK